MYLITLIIHYVIGFGILNRLNVSRNKVEVFGLAFPIGLGIGTLAILIMDILGLSLTLFSTTIVFAGLGMVLIFPDILKISQTKHLHFSHLFIGLKKIYLAEWILLGFIFFLYGISFWRCFYLPITPYDTIVGIDLVAKYAVEEGRIDSQMFTGLEGHMTTQPYYAPFTTLSQIIYRLSGHDFGKIWLTFMFLSLWVVFYINLRKEIHPILAGFLTIVLISIPEMYAYTFMVQTDFSNAVFICLSVIYLSQFIQKQKMSYFWLASLLFGFGVWSRSESIAFATSTAVLLFLFLYFRSDKKFNAYKLALYSLLISFFFFTIWNLYYLPVVLNYSPESYFKIGFWDPDRLIAHWNGMLGILTNTVYWGYNLHFFIIVVIINLIFFRDKKNIFILLWIVVLFLSFLILFYHLQLSTNSNINNTFRRGTFKFWPIMIYYIGISCLIKKLSDKIGNWELGIKQSVINR